MKREGLESESARATEAAVHERPIDGEKAAEEGTAGVGRGAEAKGGGGNEEAGAAEAGAAAECATAVGGVGSVEADGEGVEDSAARCDEGQSMGVVDGGQDEGDGALWPKGAAASEEEGR